MNDRAIDAVGLTKAFGSGSDRVRAVRGLDLRVRPGELVAFLGPNGAGKTTSLRLLTTLLEPSGGMATVSGHDVRTEPAAVRGRIGYVGQLNSAGHNQRVRDEIVMQGRFHGLSKSTAGQRADSLLASLELEGLATRMVSTLSGGQRRRLDIAMALVHAPPLLFLDEPSTGLDPQSRANLWRHIRRLRDEHGTTVFVTTHYLDEADEFAERVLVMDHGRVIADDTPAGLKGNLIGDRVTLEFGGEAAAERALPRLREFVPGSDGEPLRHADGRVEMPVSDAGAALPGIILALAREDVTVCATETRRPTLDDVFLRLTGRSLRESGVADGTDADESAREVAA